ncbi:hypothetical protein OHA25_47390 [Nonomuraea sp. NBC_00507]|uniref:hypothetical protein n=1 Tax=Nonomuraea sp. NBC_00507 TaxID=2976002 RepID=UPI002E18C65E
MTVAVAWPRHGLLLAEAAGADGGVAVVLLRGRATALADRLRVGGEVLAALPDTRVCAGLSAALRRAGPTNGRHSWPGCVTVNSIYLIHAITEGFQPEAAGRAVKIPW